MIDIAKFDSFIFDLDGTLLDSMQMWSGIFDAVLVKLGVQAPENFIQTINHISVEQGAKITVETLKLNISEEVLIKIWCKEAVERYSNTVKLKPYAMDFLKILAENNKKIGVATASDPRLFMSCLENNNVTKYIQSYTTIDEVSRGKGFPDIYLKECEKLGSVPERSVVFEDSFTGIKGAKSGGFITCGVYDEVSKDFEKDIIETADIFIHSFCELI